MTDETPYPNKPLRPRILGRLPIDLTLEELKSLPEVKASYEAEMATYKEGVSAYNQAQAVKLDALRGRCEVEFGMVGHKKADLLWSMAWDRGHSSGLQEVYGAYADLVELAR